MSLRLLFSFPFKDFAGIGKGLAYGRPQAGCGDENTDAEQANSFIGRNHV